MSVTIGLQRCNWADDALPLPRYQTAGAAGADIVANFAVADRAEGLMLTSGQRGLVPTGLRMAIPEGYEVQLRPRSGLALKSGLTLLNSPGTIDADYRGDVGVMVINHGDSDVHIAHGDRMAQMIVAPVVQARFTVEHDLDETTRGSGGFGSTGQR